MKKYYIPIIGSISSGKTTFLKGFLGIDLLQSGSTTTTKFVCLIKNSTNYSFYHVLPKKKDNTLSFEKSGEEIREEEQIKEKMIEINKTLSRKTVSINEFFYVLEMPIKTINNEFILQNCYFMDIPGLNEGDKNYIEDIFSLISYNDILFEIIIFDSTNIGSDNILKIFNSLEDKNVLKKTNNLFILNKIDQRSKDEEENIIDTFKNYFYRTFEEGQVNSNPKININIYKNHLIPMNSLLYLSETKLKDDFTSLLLFELYNYLENYRAKYPTYLEYLKKKLEFIINYCNIEINKENKKNDENSTKIIKESIEQLKNAYRTSTDVNLGLNKKNEKELKKIYNLFQLKKYPIEHSDNYKQLQEIITNININNNNDAYYLPEKEIKEELQIEQKKLNYEIYTEKTKQKADLSFIIKNNNLLINISMKNISNEYSKMFSIGDLAKLNKFFQLFEDAYKLIEGLKEIFEKNLPIIEEIEDNTNNIILKIIPMAILGDIKIKIPQKILDNITIIGELDNFLNRVFDEIDPEKELKNFRISLQTLRENIIGRKIRVSLIGNISVGKSTVLNCIIGERLLPTKDSECTYRGVILRYKKEEDFKLYKTKLISRGIGKDEYYFFEDYKKPHCKGSNSIKDYLKNKNSDTNIKDEDAYIVITGKLKIFDYFKLDENLINKIEFIDLPGNDRKENLFNKKEYYKKILKFSNCCVYINEPKNIEDGSNIEKMLEQYTNDKLKVFPNLRIGFIQTCIFLINKSDLISKNDKNEKNQIKNILIENIKKMEQGAKDNEMNISFFSGKSFEYYLNIQKNFINLLENNPTQLFNNLYKKWFEDQGSYNFKDFIINGYLSEFEEKFEFYSENEDEEEQEIEVPEDFSKKLKDALNKTIKGKIKIDEESEDEIVEKLYSIYDNFKKKNFEETIYSKEFFYTIKRVVLFSDELQNINLNLSMSDFISNADLLFKKKIAQKDNEELENFSKLYNKLASLFKTKKEKIKKILNEGKDNCMKLIRKEKENLKDNLKKADNDLEKAKNKLLEKIKNILDTTKKEQENEIKLLSNELNTLYETKKSDLFSKNTISDENINVENKNFMPGFAYMGISSILSGGAGCIGATIIDEIILTASFLPIIGLVATTAVCLLSSISVYNYLKKEDRYKEILESMQSKIIDYFDKLNSTFDNDFKYYEDSIMNDYNVKREIRGKKLDTIDEHKWKQYQNEFSNLKANIINIINYNNNLNKY